MMIETVVWRDVTKTMNDDDFNSKQNVDELLSEMRTIGWVYRETEEVLLLVQEFSGGSPRDWIAIPKSLIVKRGGDDF